MIAGTVPEAIHIPVMAPIKMKIFKTIKAFLPPSMDISIMSLNGNPLLHEMKIKIKKPSNNGKPTNIPL